MKVGDLVRRKYASEDRKQHSLKFANNARNYGITTEIDLEHDLCVVLFNGDAHPTTLPMYGGYIEVVSESAEKD
jgi:hypothetical protein